MQLILRVDKQQKFSMTTEQHSSSNDETRSTTRIGIYMQISHCLDIMQTR